MSTYPPIDGCQADRPQHCGWPNCRCHNLEAPELPKKPAPAPPEMAEA